MEEVHGYDLCTCTQTITILFSCTTHAFTSPWQQHPLTTLILDGGLWVIPRTTEAIRGSLLTSKRLLDTSCCRCRHRWSSGGNLIDRLWSTPWSIKLINSPLWFFSVWCFVELNHHQAAPHARGRKDSFLSRVRYSLSDESSSSSVKDTLKDEATLTRAMVHREILFLFSKNLENYAFALVHLTFSVAWIIVEESF